MTATPRRLFRGAAAVMLGCVLSVPASAQSASEPPANPARDVSASRELAPDLMQEVIRTAEGLMPLRTLIVARDGHPVVERAFKQDGLDEPVTVKSVSKTIISALVGVALDRRVLDRVDQPIASVLAGEFPAKADPRLRSITLDHLLTMRAGLERTSGANYGRWVASPNWVRSALSQPFVDEPGGRMLYSTGNSHLLSAILTEASERSTLDLAREWLGEPLRITIPPWTRDRQGVYLGGNDMALSPRALLRFGEMYRNGGLYEGRRVLPESWIRESWLPRTQSPHTGHRYGYGWFITEMRGHAVYYAWGYGGQMLYVVPDLGLTIVMTSDSDSPSGRTGYVQQLHALVAEGVIPAAQRQDENQR
jgi:CubicO group peptidase (beta-lactamase class C family)